MKSWKIEGSNTCDENDWKILDEKINEDCLDNPKAKKTFDIQKLKPNEYFRYLRFYQTGPDSQDEFYGCISALEYFGSMISKSD